MKTVATILAFCIYAFVAAVLLLSCALVTPCAWIIERRWFDLVQLAAWLLTLLMLIACLLEIKDMMHQF